MKNLQIRKLLPFISLLLILILVLLLNNTLSANITIMESIDMEKTIINAEIMESEISMIESIQISKEESTITHIAIIRNSQIFDGISSIENDVMISIERMAIQHSEISMIDINDIVIDSMDIAEMEIIAIDQSIVEMNQIDFV